MTEVLFGVLLQGLKLWNTKESNEYIDEVLSLQRNWLEEYNKPIGKRSDAELDYIEQQLHLISKLFISSTRKPDA